MERSYSPCCSESTIIEAYPEFSLFPKHLELMSKIENKEMGAKGTKEGGGGRLPEGETRGQSVVGGGEAVESNKEGGGQAGGDVDIFVLNIRGEKGSSSIERERTEGGKYLVQFQSDNDRSPAPLCLLPDPIEEPLFPLLECLQNRRGQDTIGGHIPSWILRLMLCLHPN